MSVQANTIHRTTQSFFGSCYQITTYCHCVEQCSTVTKGDTLAQLASRYTDRIIEQDLKVVVWVTVGEDNNLEIESEYDSEYHTVLFTHMKKSLKAFAHMTKDVVHLCCFRCPPARHVCLAMVALFSWSLDWCLESCWYVQSQLTVYHITALAAPTCARDVPILADVLLLQRSSFWLRCSATMSILIYLRTTVCSALDLIALFV